MKNNLTKEYEKLKNNYKTLRKKYRELENPSKIKDIAEFKIKKYFLDITLIIIISYGFYYYRHPLIIIFGLLISILDFIWETHCIKIGMWKYNTKNYFPNSKIPILLPLFYFLAGAFFVVYVLFRM